MIEMMRTAKFQTCPIFPNMFSDLPSHPRKHKVMRRGRAPPNFMLNYKSKHTTTPPAAPPDVVGADRSKFFDRPLKAPQELTMMPILHVDNKIEQALICVPTTRKKNRRIQTRYRESYVQTIPWEPPFIVTDGTDPELLKLEFLKWGSGLPAGIHEVILIERARMKRAWEEKLKQESGDLEMQRQVVDMIERDEWAFREQEIQDIHDLRLQLLEEMLNELHEKAHDRNARKLEMFAEMKQNQKKDKLEKLHIKMTRERRKLDLKNKGISRKYEPVNITTEHVHHTSEIYAPLIRYGQHPKRWHQVIDNTLKRYKAQFEGVEMFSTLPARLNQTLRINHNVKLPGTRLCIRETKWTAPVLRQLHDELKALNDPSTGGKYVLIPKSESSHSDCKTPEVEAITDIDEDRYQAAITLQSIIRGRASQMNIYGGRDRCRQLIEDLKYCYGLLDEQKIKINDNKFKVQLQQKAELMKQEHANQLLKSLNQIQGNLVGSLLDLLNKELKRLFEERRAHALCLLIERERRDREAAEAGRRQKELRRRLEHDEVFKHIVKVQQDTVDLYLSDIIKEGMDFTSEEEAKEYIERLARKIDEQIADQQLYIDEKDENIADLVHHFVLPEVEKRMLREKLRRKQMQNLRTIHTKVNDEIEHVPVNASTYYS